MNAVDTNILIYSLDDSEPVKQPKARTLLRRLRKPKGRTIMPWQVIGEFLRHLRWWVDQGVMTPVEVRQHVSKYRSAFPIVLPSVSVLDRAMDLFDAHSLSHWDSMLVAACLEAGVDTLFTEDMGAPRVIESLHLENPFI